MSDGYRLEKDSLGEVRVPTDVLYGAQTQRAVENFPISGQRFGRGFIRALGLVKKAAAFTNQELGNLDGGIAEAIAAAAGEVAAGKWDAEFVVDIFRRAASGCSDRRRRAPAPSSGRPPPAPEERAAGSRKRRRPISKYGA